MEACVAPDWDGEIFQEEQRRRQQSSIWDKLDSIHYLGIQEKNAGGYGFVI